MQSSLAEYERSADATRKRLSSTLDELATSLTPGRILDEVLSYARAGGGDFLKSLGRAASANPVPTILIGVGAAMFLSGKGRVGNSANGLQPGEHGYLEANRNGAAGESAIKSATKAIGDTMSAVGSSIAEKVGNAASSARGGAASVGGTASRTASGIAEAASATLSTVGESAHTAGSAVAEQVTGYASSARDQLVDRGEKALDQSSRLFTELRARGSELVHEQPLVVAAIGLALGAAVAALLPRSQAEDSLMGQASDAVKGAVGGIAGDSYRQAKETTEKAFDEAKSAFAKEGLSAAGAADMVRTFGDQLASVATDNPEAVKPNAP